ncbi:MAG TPA: hypothetical protein VFK06_12975 [Candidatus Angelobacter sp.]|nr:hypothetical protein [Candidatus Angelobacter sp.]
MRLLLAAFICFCWAGAACGQNGNSDSPTPLTSEEMIRQMIELRSVEGQMQKRIGNMGDAAAVVVTRILAGDKPWPLDIDMVLTVLDLSFADPSAVATVADRQPRTTLLVMQYLDFWAKDPALKARIAESRRYIQEQYAKYLKASAKK